MLSLDLLDIPLEKRTCSHYTFRGFLALVQHLMAFDEVWPADLPALRPLRLNLRRSCGAGRANADVGHSDDNARNGEGQSGGGRFGGPVFLMPMHRRGKGVQGRYDTH